MERAAKHFAERRFGIDGTRVDGETGSFHRKAFFSFRKAEIVADEVHEIGGVFPIMDGECRGEADIERVFTEEPRANRMERP